MRIRLYRFIILLLVLAVLLAACRPLSEPMAHELPPDMPASAEAAPVTLSLLLVSGARMADPGMQLDASPRWAFSYEDGFRDEIAEALLEATGVTLEMTCQENLDVPLAADALGDMVFACGYEVYLENEAVCQPLEPLMEQACPGVLEQLDPLERQLSLAADGQLYSLKQGYRDPNAYLSGPVGYRGDNPFFGQQGVQEICLRADLADQIPAQAMRSLEELERALYQLRGQEKALGVSCLFQIDDALALQAETLTNQDLMRLHSIGACFATFPLASSMGIRQEPYWNEALGQVSLPWRDDAWLPYLTMMNRWHRDGILQYTWEELTSRAVSFEPGLVFAQGLISFRPDWQGASAVLNQNLRASQQGGRTGSDGLSYRPLPQPLTYQGDYQAVAADYGQPRFGLYITQRCRNPQRAASFAAYLRSAEGARLTQWGVEGKHYRLTDEGLPQWLSPYDQPALRNERAGIGKWAFMSSAWYQDARIQAQPADGDEFALADAQQALDAEIHYHSEAAADRDPWMNAALLTQGDPEYPDMLRLALIWHRQVAKLIVTAQSEDEVARMWRQVQDDMSARGIGDLERIMTERYLRARQR